MKKQEYKIIENYMKECMNDTVHDKLHVFRVVSYAAQIAEKTTEAHYDIVIIAAMLHDIGRIDEQRNPNLCHAEVGSQKAYDFLLKQGYSEQVAKHVYECILTHRHKKGLIPQSIEAKIVFDADKLDLIGAVGCARAILFGGQIDEPLYCIGKDGLPTKGTPDEEPSLFREYHRKLCNLSEKLYTIAAKELAISQQDVMNQYFESLISEVNNNYQKSTEIMEKHWD